MKTEKGTEKGTETEGTARGAGALAAAPARPADLPGPLWGSGAILRLDRAGIRSLAARTDADMASGGACPLRLLAMSKKAMELFSAIERAARARLDLHIPRGGAHTAHGCEITERETGVRYDYSVCGDAEWESLAAEAARLESRKKEREAFLRTVPERRIGPGGACANPVFGPDGAEILPPLRSGALGYAVAIK